MKEIDRIPTYKPASLAKMQPAEALRQAHKVWRRAVSMKKPARWKAAGEIGKLMRVALPSPPLVRLKGKHRGKRAFIIGNAPSLDKMNLSPLANEVVLCCNRIFLHHQMTFSPAYYTVNDYEVIAGMAAEINTWLAQNPTTIRLAARPATIVKPLPALISVLVGLVGNPRVYFANLRHQPHTKPCFSTDVSKGICQNGTTIYFLMQWAYYLGCNPVYLIGCDCTAPPFPHPKYYAKVKKRTPCPEPTWQMVFGRYRLAKRTFEKNGRSILNATVGGRLEVFKRVQYRSLF